MRVGIIGLGGVGGVLATELRDDRRVASLLLMDKSAAAIRALASALGRKGLDTKQVDANRREAVAKAIRGCDVVVNAALSECNLTVMRAALDEGVAYLDVAATGPRRPGGLPGILEQLRMHGTFRRAGVTALLSMGLDPGMSNVLAREAADTLDTIQSIRIRSGGTLRIRNGKAFPRFVPLYSREAFFSDVRIRPTVWQDGRLEDREPLSEEEAYAFPPPVGIQPTFLVSHEEVKTLPLFLGKPVGRVDFKYAIDPDLASVLPALDRLNLLKEERTIRLDGRRISFRLAFQEAFPEPVEIVRRLAGMKCVSVDVEGTRGGVRTLHQSHIAFSHEEAIRRRGTSAVYYMTGLAAAIGVGLLGERATPGAGVHPPESLDPARVIRDWTSHRLSIARSERTIPS